MKTIYDLAKCEYETLEEAMDALRTIASLANDADNVLRDSSKDIMVMLRNVANEIVHKLEETKEIIY